MTDRTFALAVGLAWTAALSTMILLAVYAHPAFGIVGFAALSGAAMSFGVFFLRKATREQEAPMRSLRND